MYTEDSQSIMSENDTNKRMKRRLKSRADSDIIKIDEVDDENHSEEYRDNTRK